MKKTIAATLIFLSLNLSATESQLEIKHRDPKGVGYDTGYTTVDYFLTHRFGTPQFLFNARGHVFNNGKLAANGGFGLRYPWMEEKFLFGANLFYDFRSDDHITAHQAGAGLEFLFRRVDLRFNGYYPFGGERSYEERHFKRPEGNTIIIDQKVASTLPKVEMELGIPWGRYAYFAGGPYYLFKEKTHGTTLGNAFGGSLRLKVDLGKYLWVEGAVTYDSIFKTRGQGIIAIRLLGMPARTADGRRNLWSTPVYRSEIIPIEKKKRELPLSRGGDDSGPLRFIFVNNMSPGGNGTFEAPFDSLKAAEESSQPGDVIYVFPGDGSTRNMDEGIILKDDQTLASSGRPLEVEDVVIPPMTPGQMPAITNIHPDEPIIVNPGNSDLSAFRVIEPWEYLLDLGDRDSGGVDTIDVGVQDPVAPIIENHFGEPSDEGSGVDVAADLDLDQGPLGGDAVVVDSASEADSGVQVEAGSDGGAEPVDVGAVAGADAQPGLDAAAAPAGPDHEPWEALAGVDDASGGDWENGAVEVASAGGNSDGSWDLLNVDGDPAAADDGHDSDADD